MSRRATTPVGWLIAILYTALVVGIAYVAVKSCGGAG